MLTICPLPTPCYHHPSAENNHNNRNLIFSSLFIFVLFFQFCPILIKLLVWIFIIFVNFKKSETSQ